MLPRVGITTLLIVEIKEVKMEILPWHGLPPKREMKSFLKETD